MTDPVSRGAFLAASAASGAASTLAQAPAAGGSSSIRMRWYGGGVYELAPPGDRTIVLVDAWIWNNTGFTAYGIAKPAELASAAAYVAHLQSRKPETVIVALTHDHGDHMGDYFELLSALAAGGLDVKTVGQSDLMRVGLVQKFRAANLDPAQIVLNGGAGINMGGTATHKGVTLELVRAIHSTASGFPPAGFIIDVGGVRVYASGDTDLFGDMALIGKRYAPDLAVVSSGNGAFTMGPEDAASACAMAGVRAAVPVHYAHNPLVLGPQCGDLFRAAMSRIAPSTAVTVLRPGETATISLTPRTRPEHSSRSPANSGS
jgi:L-ascorbate metabolism protein UlaG (beta-lactamase superfamily)